MKKILIALSVFLIFNHQVSAENFENIKYKNISNKSKISYNTETMQWSGKVNVKKDLYFIKTKGFGNYSDYLNSDKDFAFTTNCEYEFLKDGKFIGYSNNDMMFYSFDYVKGDIVKSALVPEEVQNLFPEYKIIKLSDFSTETNALKIKKDFGNMRVIIYNDINADLRDYEFSTGNSEFEPYKLNGLLNIKKSGMIQLSKKNSDKDGSPWFILLVR